MTTRPESAPGIAALPGRTAQARVRLGGPGALVACLPQLVGFTPTESLVLVGLAAKDTGRDELVMTMRLDLTTVQAALERFEEEHADLVGELYDDPDDYSVHDRLRRLAARRAMDAQHPAGMATVLLRNGCDRFVAIVVSEHAAAPVRWGSIRPVEGALCPIQLMVWSTLLSLNGAGLRTVDALLVRSGSWWSYECSDESCCPTSGTPIQASDADLLQAELTWIGESSRVLADRSEVVAAVARRDDDQSRALLSALAGREAPDSCPDRAEALRHVAALLQRFGEPEPVVTTDEWARLLVDLHDVVVRDACLATWKGAAGRRALDLWCAATRLAPAGHVAPPATMAAVVAHARGDGALSGEAVDRALADDASYRLATYSAQLLAAGTPPTQVRRTIVGAVATLRARGEPVLDGQGRPVEGPSPRRGRTRR